MKVIRDDMVCFHLVFMYLTGAVNIIYQPKEYNRLSHISLVENKGNIIPLLSRAIFDIPDQSSSIASLWTIPTGIAAIQIDCSKAKYFFYFTCSFSISHSFWTGTVIISNPIHIFAYILVCIFPSWIIEVRWYIHHTLTPGEKKNIKEISI